MSKTIQEIHERIRLDEALEVSASILEFVTQEVSIYCGMKKRNKR